MKRYIFLLFIIPLLTSCGAGGGGGVVSSPGGGDNNTSCSSQSSLAKIRIKGDGIYKVTYVDLYNACVDLLRAAPAALKMTNQGNEIAIDVIDSNKNGSFDDGDYIEFYGKALSRGDSRFRFTEANVYWLSAEAGARKRIAGIQSNPNASQGAASFLKTLHMEEDIWYEQKNYPEVTSAKDVREHWFWGEVFYTPGIAGNIKEYYLRDYNFSTPYVDKTGTASLRLRLQSVNGTHHIKGYINDKLVVDRFELTWDGQEALEIEVSYPTSYLNNGPNLFRLESVGDTPSGIYEVFYLDWFEIRYDHTYYAEHDVLEFTGDGLIGVSNFSTATDLSIYEISDPANVRKIIPAEPEWTSSSGYKVVFSNPRATAGRFLALSGANKKIPVVEAYTPADLKTKDASYIIITHGDFYDAIKSLADYRSRQGYKVLIVKVNDVYDEFSYGIETPQAIKDFLRYAHEHWLAGPKYALLVGDATVDYKDISGYGRGYGVKSYIPAYLYNYPGLGEVPSDNWFVDLVDNPNDVHDVLPEMNIGRIPAKSPADVTAVVSKIVFHETSSSLKSNEVVLVADYDMVSKTLFETLSESIAKLIPSPDYSATKLYQSAYPFRQLRTTTKG